MPNNLTYKYGALNMLCKLKGAGHCTSAKTHDQHLEACCRGISSCWAGDNLKHPSSHRHCYQYLNGAKLCLSDLNNDDSRYSTSGCSLMSYPGRYDFELCKLSLLQKNYKESMEFNSKLLFLVSKDI